MSTKHFYISSTQGRTIRRRQVFFSIQLCLTDVKKFLCEILFSKTIMAFITFLRFTVDIIFEDKIIVQKDILQEYVLKKL